MSDGGPAFPRATYVELEQTEYHPNRPGLGAISGDDGMSLRDWFAGRALQAIIATDSEPIGFSAVASECYKYADAMLAERAKGATP